MSVRYLREGVCLPCRDPQRFLTLARRAQAAAKLIVLLHPGQSHRAREAAKSHTGALAGDHAIMRACVEREGVIVVGGLDELFDVTTLVTRYPRPVTGGVGVLSNSGALRGFSLDFCEEIGLDLPELASVNPWALALALGAAAGVFWLRAGLLRVLAASAAAGVVLYLAGVTL